MTRPTLRTAPFVLLDDSRPGRQAGRSLLFRNPVAVLRADTAADLPDTLAALDAHVAEGKAVAGFLSYEAAGALEGKVKAVMQDSPEPLLYMLVCDKREVLTSEDVDDLLLAAEGGTDRRAEVKWTRPNGEAERFVGAVDQIQDYIRAGDVYQVNMTFARHGSLEGDPLALYRRLRATQPVPYGALIGLKDGRHILSLSPELMLARQADQIAAQPMKGTAARGLSWEDDHSIQEALKADPKTRAENLMITDLIRNDMSRIAAKGSVSVSNLFQVSALPSVWQMTSTVHATARPDLAPSTALRALFPCGSVTGAPKIRAMEVIGRLETEARGVYCGTIGHFSPGQDWSLNVPIRTLVATPQHNTPAQFTLRLHMGAGIVADSEAEAEYRESDLKSAFVSAKPYAPALIETLRVENGCPLRLDAHLTRLAASAARFGYPCDRAAIRASIEAHLSQAADNGARKMRLLLGPVGDLTLESVPLPAAPDQHELWAGIAAPTIDAGHLRQHHKTTDRALYDKASQEARRLKLADLLFFNTHGLLAEGAISSVFIREGDIWLTPRLSDGALPGIMRAEEIKRLSAKECGITRSMLETAAEIRLTNALRGARVVRLRDGRDLPLMDAQTDVWNGPTR